MSDIKAGDTVMVAYALPCCGGGSRFGFVYRVSAVYITESDTLCCALCHTPYPILETAIIEGDDRGFPTFRLIRLPPLEELESRKEEVEST